MANFIKNFHHVELLLAMTGPNNGTSFSDWSNRGRGVTRAGVVTSTARKKFDAYEGSGLFSGSAQWLEPHFVVRRTGDLFIGVWVYPTKVATANGVLNSAIGAFSSNTAGRWYLGHRNDRLVGWVAAPSGGTSIYTESGTVPRNEWSYLSMQRNASGLIKYAVNGQVVHSQHQPTSLINSNCVIGAYNTGGSNEWFGGNMQDLIVVHGEMSFDGDFEPPPRLANRTLTRVSTGVDSHEYGKAVLFDWDANGWGLIRQAIPDANGNFVATGLRYVNYGIVFSRSGCDTIFRGPFEVDPD